MGDFVQYCPIAIAADVIGDRWTPLVLRELLLGSTRFNEIHRGIPHVSRSLLAGRLRRLERLGILTRSVDDSGTPHYELTPSGDALACQLITLGEWAVQWSLGDPTPEQIDPQLLLWRMHRRVNLDSVPARRVTIQFDFHRPHTARGWLVLDHHDSTVCVHDPGYDVDVWVKADATALLKVWIGKLRFETAVERNQLTIDGPRQLTTGFSRWFTWSPFHDLVVANDRTPSPAKAAPTAVQSSH
jgi:DNA-binding HxlR family transcriptional regulator